MFDPSLLLDDRLATECKIKNPGSFLEVPPGSECELKVTAASYKDFAKIIEKIASKSNRIIDYRSYSSDPRPVVTFNLDTVNPVTGQPTEKIRRAGYSARLRASLKCVKDKAGSIIVLDEIDLDKIDFSVKTHYPDENVIALFAQRGEWEAHVETLSPDFKALAEQNKHCREYPLPKLFRNGNIKPDEICVVSIGCCWRQEYNHFHLIDGCAVVYSQTQDITNFTTPHGDFYHAIFDKESEAEILGVWGIEKRHAYRDKLAEIQSHSLSKTRALIESASCSIARNHVTKAERGRLAIQQAYGEICEPLNDPTLVKRFGLEAITPEQFALMQKVRPDEININNLAHIVRRAYFDLDHHTPEMPRQAFRRA